MRPILRSTLFPLLAGCLWCSSAAAQFTLSTEVGMGMDDAEITHDGRFAIVRENSWNSAFRIYDLRNGQLIGMPGCTDTVSGACQDAIGLTASRAVLLGSCAMVLDLTALPAVNVLATHPVGTFPRDVAITPDGTIAAVRGGSQGGLFLLDLAGGALLAQAPGAATLPTTSSYSFDVDSVVASDKYAVFLSIVGPVSAPRARVTIFDLHPQGGGPPVIALETSGAGADQDQFGAPHDVALSPDGKFAVVRSELSVALYRLDGAAPVQAWHKRLWGQPGPFFSTALDSIEVTAARIATISRFGNGLAGTQLDVFDVAGQQKFARMVGAPHDLAITPAGGRVVVHSSAAALLFDLVNLPSGVEMTPLAETQTPSTHTSFSAGLDSVVVTDDRAVVLSRMNNDTQVLILDLEGDSLAARALHAMPNKPVDVDISPDGNLAGVVGTDHVLVLDLRTDAAIFDDPVVFGGGFFPWCDGVALDDQHLVAFGYTDAQAGWVSVVDLFKQPASYCTAAPNSVGPGALLHVTGSASLAANDLELWTIALPPQTRGLFTYGDAKLSTPFGNGFLCVGGTAFGFAPLVVNASGVATQSVDYTGTVNEGGAITAGSTWNFQFRYRDPAGGGEAFNLSDAVSVHFLN
jgi:DNA-binding beta-propeller fold protein YncE